LYSADRAIKVSSHKHAEIIEAKEW
jgi:hypothetical protein